MRTAGIALPYLLSILLAAAAAAQAPQHEKLQLLLQQNLRDSEIIVTILDHATAPVAGAHITILDDLRNMVMDGETDLQGELKTGGLPFGKYTITARAPGFADHCETVRVTEHQLLALTIDLSALQTIDSGWPYEPPLADLMELATTDLDSIPLIRSVPLPILTHKHRLPFRLHRGKNPT